MYFVFYGTSQFQQQYRSYMFCLHLKTIKGLNTYILQTWSYTCKQKRPCIVKSCFHRKEFMKTDRDFTPTLVHHQRLFKLIQRTMPLSSSAKNLLPSNLLISSGGNNFVTPTANFCAHLLGLFYQISKNSKNILSLNKFSLLMLLYAAYMY